METMSKFLAEAKKNLDIEPTSGQELGKIAKDITARSQPP